MQEENSHRFKTRSYPKDLLHVCEGIMHIEGRQMGVRIQNSAIINSQERIARTQQRELPLHQMRT